MKSIINVFEQARCGAIATKPPSRMHDGEPSPGMQGQRDEHCLGACTDWVFDEMLDWWTGRVDGQWKDNVDSCPSLSLLSNKKQGSSDPLIKHELGSSRL
jgi:hypothetical protein